MKISTALLKKYAEETDQGVALYKTLKFLFSDWDFFLADEDQFGNLVFKATYPYKAILSALPLVQSKDPNKQGYYGDLRVYDPKVFSKKLFETQTQGDNPYEFALDIKDKLERFENGFVNEYSDDLKVVDKEGNEVGWDLEANYKPDEPSWMIALYPSSKSVDDIIRYRNLLYEQGDELWNSELLNPRTFHCTIRFWKNQPELLEEVINSLKTTELPKKITAKFNTLDMLGEDCVVIRSEDKDIKSVFDTIDNTIQSLGVPPSDYATFKPHITLAHGVTKIPRVKKPNLTIILDRLALVNKEDDVLFEVNL